MIHRSIKTATFVALAVAMSVLGSTFALGSTSGNSSNAAAQGPPSHVASAFGRAVVEGQETFVHVTVAGVSADVAEAAALAELERRGAVPVQSAEYSKNGTWKQFNDSNPDNNRVELRWSTYGSGTNYLFDRELNVLSIAAQDWNSVATSSFLFSYAGETGVCPSLVDECPNSQVFNNVNEVGWLGLGGVSGGSITLGVTWFNFRTRGGPFAAPQEADMVLNSDVAITWGGLGSGEFETLTVAAHELGHVAGLGHSSDINALMYPWYDDAKGALLDNDDIAGISALYPVSDGGSESTDKLPGYCKKHPTRDGC